MGRSARSAPGAPDGDVPETAATRPARGTEWLETDGRGGYAIGTVGGERTRRYHAILCVASGPGRRVVLVNGFDAWIETPAGTTGLSSQRWAGGVLEPDGYRMLADFAFEPWPRWSFRLDDGLVVEQEIFVARESGATVLSWRVKGRAQNCRLFVRPFFSGRDHHALQQVNDRFRFDAEVSPGRTVVRAYDGLPGVALRHGGTWFPEAQWYRGFHYAVEEERGFPAAESLAAPGVVAFDLASGEASLVLAAEPADAALEARGRTADELARALRSAELLRRRAFASPRARAGDAYLVERGARKTIIAGYPWFADWGRDTFISLRGLCLATGRLDEARDILLSWVPALSEGMLPNRFADGGDDPEYNSVDASLWYVIAVRDWLAAEAAAGARVPPKTRGALEGCADAIVAAYAAGTRHGIRADADGLLFAGESGLQLTWMDAKIGLEVVTPRIGKPVEIQALWIRALEFAGQRDARWQETAARARAAFEPRFWNEAAGCLHDVVDADYRRGHADAAVRPNQVFALGGLGDSLVGAERTARALETIERRLWTRAGLRSLACGESGYCGRYAGGSAERDRAYHQGTVWPWLMGPFVEAWVRRRGGDAGARREARDRWFAPWIAELDPLASGQLPEIADADAPHQAKGCPFQAWSVGEALRLDLEVLAGGDA